MCCDDGSYCYVILPHSSNRGIVKFLFVVPTFAHVYFSSTKLYIVPLSVTIIVRDNCCYKIISWLVYNCTPQRNMLNYIIYIHYIVYKIYHMYNVLQGKTRAEIVVVFVIFVLHVYLCLPRPCMDLFPRNSSLSCCSCRTLV